MPRKSASKPEPVTPEYKVYAFAQYAEAVTHIQKHARTVRRGGRGENSLYNDLIIAADTETSKTGPERYSVTGEYIPQENIVVAWTVSVRCAQGNICTIYGSRPSEFCILINYIQITLQGEKTIYFFHNLSYDWPFLQRFLFEVFGNPVHQLNTKPHYPISIEFENGIIFRDSLIIAQKSLEKWADELQVDHRKACGKWDYEKIRDQSGGFSADEIEYIEHDTLALVECLDKLRIQLHKHVYSIPMTCTGIIREEVRKEGRKNRARNRFERMAPDFEIYKKLEQAYHGGFTHNNRNAAGWIWPDNEDLPTCWDFASSYPYRMLVDSFPCERFRRVKDNLPLHEILNASEDNAFLFTLVLIGVKLKDPDEPMPALQFSKCLKTVNALTDNGRILEAEYIEIVLTEIDARIIRKQYRWKNHVCCDVYTVFKGPLPRWFRDLVYKCFEDKTRLKGGDPVEYALAKAKINSLYGMCCQKSIRPEISEDYETGDFTITEAEAPELYQKYLENHNSILPYFWGVWVTAYAMEALFQLGSCVRDDGIWLYSDTDSVYACGWDQEKLTAYNDRQKERLQMAGYGPVLHNGREYWPGVAELDGQYKEFIGLHSKCYAVRKMDGSLKITVAGVPKKGAECLNGDLNNFRDGFIFPGSVTGKLTHYYMYRNAVYVDENGIEYGNSVDLHTCDYEIGIPKIDKLLDLIETEEVEVQYYDEKVLL